MGCLRAQKGLFPKGRRAKDSLRVFFNQVKSNKNNNLRNWREKNKQVRPKRSHGAADNSDQWLNAILKLCILITRGYGGCANYYGL